MSEPYIEDNGDEYPINSCIGCGQTPYKVDFEGATIDDLARKNKSGKTPGIGKAKFLPKIIDRRKDG
ncbi:hypothetical protein [Pseudomonas fluorescens]|uniref:Uncharacterized protein n=1 Tax=Pseudomonas fluorescens TaxID=294 RepID=A0A5E7EBG5_PSEFL|nr:hypothetical protein [Pseudomonas fluorescens]VVO23697.1 hypothetical protein PS723_04419 [Pseudomonas fluorescens]